MASMITSAGAASGMDFESIISASIELKRSQLENRVTEQKENASIELSGVGKLKSALEDFQKSIEALTEDNGFNARKITTSQSTDNPYFTITAKDDASNANYDIDVKQLAKTESIAHTFNKDATFSGGKLTLTVPAPTDDDPNATKSFEVNIEDGYNLAQIRKEINKNDLGITASIVSTSAGDKLVIDSGVSGKDAAFSIEFDDSGVTHDSSKYNTDSSIFAIDTENYSGSDWTITQGQDAIIKVDGEEVTSSTNEFDTQISGVTINIETMSWGDFNTKWNAGLTTGDYTYLDSKTPTLNFKGMLDDVNKAADRSCFMFHACAHNPTGVDPSHEQWDELSALCKKKNHVVLFDAAYLGYCSGNVANDAYGFRKFVEDGHNVALTLSFSPLIVYIYRGGFSLMRYSISDTAEFGDYETGKRLITDDTKKEMKKILEEIQDGTFASKWIAENNNGRAHFIAKRNLEASHPLEQVGKEIRKMYSWNEEGSIIKAEEGKTKL